jgi:glycosyltransferase involved in cell wall biosynthesis/peptidoglycan/xylan/chitin deacetylase (PgdA/CDA1 family)
VRETLNMARNCRVSVITAVFNRAEFFRETIDSVLRQTFEDWEWIVVDDGSTDETPDILEAIHDPRVRVVRQANRGVSAARNLALDLARGEFVAFLDADDRLPPESLASRIALFDLRPDSSIVEGGIRYFESATGRELKIWRPQADGRISSRLLRLDDRVICGPFFMVRRAMTEGVRFKVGMTHCEDLLFIVALSQARDIVYQSSPEIVYEYRFEAAGGAMSNMEGLDRGSRILVEELRSLAAEKPIDFLRAKFKVARILFFGWRAHGSWKAGLRAAMDVFFMSEMNRVTTKKIFFLFIELLGLNWLFRLLNRGKIKVLLFHNIENSPTGLPNIVRQEDFEKQLDHLQKSYNVISMGQNGTWINYNQKRVNVFITFDDGLVNNYSHAFPILVRRGLSACFFVISSCLESGAPPEFFSKSSKSPEALRDYQTITAEQAKEMLGHGMSIGCHGHGHIDYEAEPFDAGIRDAIQAKVDLERLLGIEVAAFAFPWGRSQSGHAEQLKNDFNLIFSTEHGFNAVGDRLVKRNEVATTLHLYAAASGALDFFSKWRTIF